MARARSTYSCSDCGPLAVPHWRNYLSDVTTLVLPRFFVQGGGRVRSAVGFALDRVLALVGLLRIVEDFELEDVPARSRWVLQEMRRRGWRVRVLLDASGRCMNHYYFQMSPGGRTYHFEGLPRAEHRISPASERIDEKQWVKKQLRSAGFPVATGRSFWCWHKKRATTYAHQIGFPVVVKPFFGSMSQHVYLNIQDAAQLSGALAGVCRYSPLFMVEEYVPVPSVYRCNVVNQQEVFVARRTPAYVVGDGQHTIRELVEIKNQDPERGVAGDQTKSRYRIVIDERSMWILEGQGYTPEGVPEVGRRVFIQDKVLLDLGAEIAEVTSEAHPDNLELARRIAQHFGVYLVGIDLLLPDITRSWREQEAAILELNSLPYVDIHHSPEIGVPQDIACAICDMVEERYS